MGNLIFIVKSHNILAFADSEKDGKGDIAYCEFPTHQEKKKNFDFSLFFILVIKMGLNSDI